MRELLAAILSGGVVGGQIDLVVVMNQAKANPIQPAGSAQYIPVDHRVGKEVDRRVRCKTESVEFDRNTPHGKPQWARPVYPDMTPENIHWIAFLGESPELPFDAHRFVNWRYFWDYSGGSVFENMSHQLAFWYKTGGPGTLPRRGRSSNTCVASKRLANG